MASGGWRPRTLLTPTVQGPACTPGNHRPECTSPQWGQRSPLAPAELCVGPGIGTFHSAPGLAAVAPPFRWDFLCDLPTPPPGQPSLAQCRLLAQRPWEHS